jgi:hypothetical protein
MAVYLVERDLPGVTPEQLAAAQKKAIQVGKDMTAQGREVRYIRSTFVPGENRCMCLFEARIRRMSGRRMRRLRFRSRGSCRPRI